MKVGIAFIVLGVIFIIACLPHLKYETCYIVNSFGGDSLLHYYIRFLPWWYLFGPVSIVFGIWRIRLARR